MRKLRQGLNNLPKHMVGEAAEAGSDLGSVWPHADVIPCLLHAVPSPCCKPGNTFLLANLLRPGRICRLSQLALTLWAKHAAQS